MCTDALPPETMMLPNTISLLELSWTVIAMIAFGFTVWIVNDNARNYAAIRAEVRRRRGRTWGPRWWVAFASLVSSVAMLFVWVGFLLVGVLSMTAGVHSDAAYRAWVSSVSGWTLVGMATILAGIQIWQVFARSRIRSVVPVPPTLEEAALSLSSSQEGIAERERT